MRLNKNYSKYVEAGVVYVAINDLFSPERVNFNLVSINKDEVIGELVHMLFLDGKITDEESFKRAIFKREKEFSTGIGMGIAVPHAKSNFVKEPSIAFGRSLKGIEFNSIDGSLAHYVFLIAVPVESSDIHLRALSEISRKLMHKDIREKILSAKNYEDFIEILK